MEQKTQAPRTLVIGAAGFVGGHLINELKKAGHTTFSADIPQYNLLNKEGIEKLVQDFVPNYIVNLAAISSVGASWKNPVQTVEVNIKGTLHLLDAIQKFVPNAKTLLIGSAEEYARKETPITEDDPLEASNPYGITKIAQENFAELYRQKYGMKIVCTRSFNHTGIGQTTAFALPSFVKQVADIFKSGHPGEIRVGNLNAIRDFSDVEDVVYVYRLLLENENKFNVYNVGSGIAYKLNDLLNYIVSLANIEIKISTDPEKFRPVDLPYLCADNTRIKALGYWKATDIHETLKKMFENELSPSK